MRPENLSGNQSETASGETPQLTVPRGSAKREQWDLLCRGVEEGEEGARAALEKILSSKEAASLSQPDISGVLAPSLTEETPRNTSTPTIDEGLRRTLKEGPSSLIDGQIQERLGVVTAGRAFVEGIPRKAWMLNPRAGLEALRAIANDASTQAGVQREISETAEWMAKVAGDDAKRDALLSYSESLEATLGQYVKPFCEERGFVVPEENTLGRMTLLLRMNAEMRAVHERGREIARAGEALVRKQVRIQAETARDTMLARELPQALEVAREANVAKEAFLTERSRNALASITATFSGGLSGAVGGFFAGIENSISTLVKEHPKVAIPLGAGLGVVTLQLVAYNGLPSWSVLGSFALKGLLVAGFTTVATGVGAGLVARMTDRSLNVPPVV